MNPERWRRVKHLLHNALELPPVERQPYLDRECLEDPELRREVESLMMSHDESGDFLDDAGPPAAGARVGGTAVARSGERIGAYQVLREIGRGGMGAVYLATRADDVFRKRVAVKILRRGLDGDYVLKRFRNERQILASLEHPNIASLLDGGSTPDGQPYFVMEYIDGQPIDEYCDQQRLSTADRLKLFCKVCSAVQFAHEHRIIHRDIKPANILIHTAGEPKLLDFGIAKILDPDFTGDTVDPTITQLRMMTPEYASPEQIRGEPVTEASDIYSLGVLLYELLTGHKPYAVRSRTPHEVAHAICEEQPERPSTVIGRVEHTTRRGATPLTITPEYVSEVRATDPADLRRSLAGDLDNIVLMAMRKEPNRRYQSAGALAADIMRHLEGRPVRARSDTLAYRVTKLVQRHRGMILATSLAACGAALAVTVMQREHAVHAPLIEFTQARTVPFTTFAGDESQAAFSPDGKRIAFVWKGARNENPDIYVKDINGLEPLQRLTTAAADDTSPAWSPDGRQIAFLRTARDRAGFYMVRATGGEEQKIADASPLAFERMSGEQVVWRNAKSLLIVDRPAPEKPFAIYELRLADGSRRQITHPPDKSVGDVSIALSPDGKTLAFARVPSSGISELYSAALDGEGARQLTNDQRWVMSATWSPDGSEIVFVSNRIGNPAVWRIPASGGTPVRLAGVGQNSTDPAFSADGRHLAYSQITVDANIWRFDLKLGRAENLISSTQYDSSPFYSPDGKRIVFRSTRSGTNELWVCDADGSSPVQITNYRGPLTGTPRWSPDGKWIAYDSRPEGSAHIYLIAPIGGTPRRVTDTVAENVVPSFSHDSKWVYFASNRSGGTHQVWKQPLDGGPAVQVTRNGGFGPLESPDGKYIYYAKGRTVPGLWRIPVHGGEELEVLLDLKVGYWGYWAPTARGILYVDKASATTPAVIYMLNPDTEQRQKLGEITKPLTPATSALSVSPDGRYVIYSQQDQSSSDITLAEAAEK